MSSNSREGSPNWNVVSTRRQRRARASSARGGSGQASKKGSRASRPGSKPKTKKRSKKGDKKKGKRKGRMQSRLSSFERERYKTELCRSFLRTQHCAYGDTCMYAHGKHELRQKPRNSTYKTQPCAEICLDGSCSYGARCNYVHPTAGLRRPFGGGVYWDEAYEAAQKRDYPGIKFPFGVYV